MKQKYYIAPQTQVEEVSIERMLASSPDLNTNDDKGIGYHDALVREENGKSFWE